MENSSSRKTVVTIMDRVYAGEDDNGNARYMYTFGHIAMGYIDKKDGTFTDQYGNKFGSITNTDVIYGDKPHAYANETALTEVKKMANDNINEVGKEISMQDSISLYEYTCKQIIYFAGQTKEGKPLCIGFNVESLVGLLSLFKDDAEEEIQEDSNKRDYTVETSNFDELINNVVKGFYSLEELMNINDQLNYLIESIMDASEAVENQIESIKNKTTYSEAAQKRQKEKEENKKAFEKEIKELQEAKKEKIKKININELYQKVTKTLISQDEPTRRVITELVRKELHDLKKREGILLAGPTGVGKTKMMELIAKYIDRPFLKVDTTQLTVPGYVGTDIEEILWDLYIKCGRDIEKTEHAIIYFDEIDKKGTEKNDDVNGKGVLNLLLKFIEGSVYYAYPDSKRTEQKVKIDTTNMTVILGGAFSDVYKNIHIKNQIGFDSEKLSVDKIRNPEPKDFVEYGQMTNEFMGRVVVIQLNELSVEDLQRVLVESDESALKIQEEIFNEIGVKIKFTDDYIKAVALKAFKKETGARRLAGIVDESTWKAFDEVSSTEGIYSHVTFDTPALEDNSKYKLIKRRKKKEK